MRRLQQLRKCLQKGNCVHFKKKHLAHTRMHIIALLSIVCVFSPKHDFSFPKFRYLSPYSSSQIPTTENQSPHYQRSGHFSFLYSLYSLKSRILVFTKLIFKSILKPIIFSFASKTYSCHTNILYFSSVIHSFVAPCLIL